MNDPIMKKSIIFGSWLGTLLGGLIGAGLGAITQTLDGVLVGLEIGLGLGLLTGCLAAVATVKTAGTTGGVSFGLYTGMGVGAFLGGLIGILIPTLTRARESANSVKCASNARQLAMAIRTFAEEHRGYMPAASDHDTVVTYSDPSRQIFTYRTDPGSSPKLYDWACALLPYLGVRGGEYFFSQTVMQGKAGARRERAWSRPNETRRRRSPGSASGRCASGSPSRSP